MKKIQKSKKGFTLVEMVLVIAIIVILAAVLLLGIGTYLNAANAAYVLKIGAADGDLSVITGITPGSAAASGVSGAQGGEAEGGEGEELEAVGE